MRTFNFFLVLLAMILLASPILSEESLRDSEQSIVNEEVAAFVPSLLLESVLAYDFDGIDEALKNGESIDVVNDQGWSAALFAVANNDLDMLRALISRNIDLNIANNEGITPLMLAASVADKEAVETLLAANASPLLASSDGSTAYSLALASGRQIIPLLIAEGAAKYGLDSEDSEVVLQAVRNGAYVNIRNGGGWTPLIQAAAFNQLESVKQLLDMGADVNRSENDGWTALHFAASSGHEDIVATLATTRKVDFSLRNAAGKTARDLAEEEGHLEVLDLLPVNTASVNGESQES